MKCLVCVSFLLLALLIAFVPGAESTDYHLELGVFTSISLSPVNPAYVSFTITDLIASDKKHSPSISWTHIPPFIDYGFYVKHGSGASSNDYDRKSFGERICLRNLNGVQAGNYSIAMYQGSGTSNTNITVEISSVDLGCTYADDIVEFFLGILLNMVKLIIIVVVVLLIVGFACCCSLFWIFIAICAIIARVMEHKKPRQAPNVPLQHMI